MAQRRILLINYEYPPVGGGGGNATRQIAEAMARLGHAPFVITAQCGDLPEVEFEAGVTVRRIPALRQQRDRCSVPEMLAYMAAALIKAPNLARQWRVEVAVAFFSLPSGPVGWRLKRALHVPYLISLQGGDVPGFDPGTLALYHRLTGPLISALWRDANAVIANSEGLAALARAHNSGRPIAVIPAGGDIAGIAPKQAYATQGEVRLLFVGRLVKQKGLDVLVRGLANLDTAVNWRLVLIGDGPEWAALAGQAARLGIADRLELHGWVAKEALPEIYRSGDIFVLPSRDEGMPNALLEAMAAGLPVVGTRIAGTSEVVIDKQTGFLVPVEDAAALASAVTSLIVDPDKRAAFGRAGRARVETTYGWDAITALWMAAIEHAIAEGPRA